MVNLWRLKTMGYMNEHADIIVKLIKTRLTQEFKKKHQWRINGKVNCKISLQCINLMAFIRFRSWKKRKFTTCWLIERNLRNYEWVVGKIQFQQWEKQLVARLPILHMSVRNVQSLLWSRIFLTLKSIFFLLLNKKY